MRRQLGTLFALLLQDLAHRNQRRAVAGLFGDASSMSSADLAAAEEIALDELEEKNIRKRAIRALATRHAADRDTVHSLLGSAEQGVQRLAVQCLPDLYTERPADADFFATCVTIANESDDVGVGRRLIPTLLEIDVPAAVHALAALDCGEVGARRRLAEALEHVEDKIHQHDLADDAVELLDRCLTSPTEAGWRTRCQRFRDRLRPSDPA